MLLNEFSWLPYKNDKEHWVWITAQDLVTWKHGKDLAKSTCTIEKAIENSLCTKNAKTLEPDVELKEPEKEAILVVSGGEAIGIITEFDWL